MIEFVRGSLAAVGRTLMRHPDHDLRITLYPVFHVGSAGFYEALSEDLRRFGIFLLEGVRWKGFRGPLYDLAARNVGLVTQRARLQLPEGAERLSLDMSEVEFTREASALPWHWRLVLRFLRPVLWAITLTASGRHRLWDAISKEKYARRRQAADTPLSQLIKDKRDRAMCDGASRGRPGSGSNRRSPAHRGRGGRRTHAGAVLDAPELRLREGDCALVRGAGRLDGPFAKHRRKGQNRGSRRRSALNGRTPFGTRRRLSLAAI
jgi:hypothetical protein